MAYEQFDMFIILLKLKSYLISLIDDPSLSIQVLSTQKNTLLRKYPERKEEVIQLLKENKIESDGQIAFDENIQHKFKEIVIGSGLTSKAFGNFG